MERPARCRAVDPADELAVLGLHALGLAGLDCRLETARERLHRRAVAKVLEPLAGGGANALLLLLDVRHRVKTPAVAGGGRVPERPNRLPMLSGMAKTAATAIPESSTARGGRLARSTAVFALATGLSRVLGLIRESVARYYFGPVGAIFR